MREIKFRAWDSRNRQMEMIHPLDEDCPDLIERIQDAQYVVMQFTGLKDKNGKEIYEGDIIKIPDDYSGDTRLKEHTSVVEWDYDGWYAKELGDNGWRYVEIIGNIYENPDLLNLTKDKE